MPAAVAVIINQATYNCTPPVVHHEQAGSNLGCRPAAGNGQEGMGRASTVMFEEENDEEENDGE